MSVENLVEQAEKALINPKEVEEMQRALAEGSNERVDTFATLRTLSVVNASQEPLEPGETPPENAPTPGAISSSIRTENGWENEDFQNPFKGIIIRQRMSLRTKYEDKKKGAPNLISDEFDSYADSTMITIKKENAEGKWEVDFVGNYKQVKAHYSHDVFGASKSYLDLQYNLYVCTSLIEKSIVKVLVKGKSRSAFFDFMKTFKRKDGDFMSSTFILFSTEKHILDWEGKALQFPVWSFAFTKESRLDYNHLRDSLILQKELNEAIQLRDDSFNKEASIKSDFQSQDLSESHAELSQAEQEEQIPIIDLDADTPTEAEIAAETTPVSPQASTENSILGGPAPFF